MGNKVNPKSLRLLQSQEWNSIWHTNKKNNSFVHQDIMVQKFLMDFFLLRNISVSNVKITRNNKKGLKIYFNLYNLSSYILNKPSFFSLKKQSYKIPSIQYKSYNSNIKNILFFPREDFLSLVKKCSLPINNSTIVSLVKKYMDFQFSINRKLISSLYRTNSFFIKNKRSFLLHSSKKRLIRSNRRYTLVYKNRFSLHPK